MASSSLKLASGLMLLFFVTLAAGVCTEEKNVVYYNTQNIDPSTPYASNLNRLLDILINTPANTTVNKSIGDAPYTAFGRAECYGNCGQCLVEARNTIRNLTPPTIGARLCTDSCYLRFENYSF